MLQNDPHGYLHWLRKSMRQLVTFLWSGQQTLPGDTTQTFAIPWSASSPSPPFSTAFCQMSWTCKSSSKCQVCNARARGSWAAAEKQKQQQQQHLLLPAWCLNSKWKWKYADCDVDVDSDCAAQLSAKSCQLLLSKRRLLLLFVLLLLLLLFVFMLLLGWPHKKQQQRTLGGKAKRLTDALTVTWEENT